MKRGDKVKKINIYLILMLGVLGVSISAIFIKSTNAPANIIAFYRMAITFILFLPVTLSKGRDEIKAIVGSDYLWCTLSGFFLALHFITWITSLKYTSVASSTVLVSLSPVFTALIGFLLFKEKLNKRSLIGMSVAIFGSAIMGLSNMNLGSGSLLGDILALSGALFGALYITIGRGMRKKISTLTYGFLVYGSCSMVLLIINLSLRTPLLVYTKKDYLLFFGMAVCCTIGGHTIFNWSLKYLEANKVSTFLLGEPIGATIWAALLLKELPEIGQLISSLIILLGLYIFIYSTIKDSKAEKSLNNQLEA